MAAHSSETAGIDPHQVLGVGKAFTLEELRRQYKRLVLLHHPDKVADPRSTPMFQILTGCYKALLKEHEARTSDRTFMELKAGSGDYRTDQARNPTQNVDLAHIASARNFDVTRFNKVFDKTRVGDVYSSTGYDDILKSDAPIAKPKNAITKYKEPVPVSQFGGSCYELGKNAVEDWSGENTGKKGGLCFTDCRVALTAGITDESSFKQRRQYRNITDLEKERANVSFTMSEKELRKRHKMQQRDEREEALRLQRMTRADQLALERHAVSNRLLLQQQR